MSDWSRTHRLKYSDLSESTLWHRKLMTKPRLTRESNGLPLSVFEMAELGALFEANWARLVAIVRRRVDGSLGVQLDAEEIVNAAFLDARRRWRAFQVEKKVSAFVWLYRIVNDRVIEEWRMATRQKRDIQKNVP